MRYSTELFLWKLCALSGSLLRPSLVHPYVGFGQWASVHGMSAQIRYLEKQAYLEKLPGGGGDRIYRLTELGGAAAKGGQDPEKCWGRPWDHEWRLLFFDLPAVKRRERLRLLRNLKGNGFGCLQGSVWISPDPVQGLLKKLKGENHPASLMVIEGRQIAGEKDREIVSTAWDMEQISACWSDFSRWVERGQEEFKRGKWGDAEVFDAWAKAQWMSWKEVCRCDPFLPASLLPASYPGRKIWKEHRRLWQGIAESSR